MKKSVIFVILLLLFIPIAYSESVHEISFEKVNIPEELIQRGDICDSEHYVYGVIGREASISNNEITYYHKDHLGSNSLVTNEEGNKEELNRYLPFGENLEDSDETFSYTGKELDKSGLMYYGARYYDPTIGRFTQPDPIKDGFNWYVYVGNSPLNFVDPTGTTSVPGITDYFDSGYEGDGFASAGQDVLPEMAPKYMMDEVVVVGFPTFDQGTFGQNSQYNSWLESYYQEHGKAPSSQLSMVAMKMYANNEEDYSRVSALQAGIGFSEAVTKISIGVLASAGLQNIISSIQYQSQVATLSNPNSGAVIKSVNPRAKVVRTGYGLGEQDLIIWKATHNLNPESGYWDFATHGRPMYFKADLVGRGVVKFDHRVVARAIQGTNGLSGGWNGREPIRLISCWGGDCGKAADLANKLNVPVRAYYGGKIQIIGRVARGMRGGAWETFYPGQGF